jgi:hypothetical protein
VIAAAAFVVAAAACTEAEPPAAPSTSTSAPPAASAPSPTAFSPIPTGGAPSPTTDPVELPPGVPATYRQDDEPGDLPAADLVPSRADVTGTSFPSADTVVVTYASGDDPFAREQGLVVWRRFPGEQDPWRARFGFRDAPSAGVLGIQVETADVTGDGEPDAISFENVGGSGVCGTWRVLALSAEADGQTYERDLCDATVAASAKPVGIRVTESVFAADDPHCCPSATRTTTFEWTGTRWRRVSTETTSGG